MKNKTASSLLISSIVTATCAHATVFLDVDAEKGQEIIQNKAACDAKMAEDTIDCVSADALFEQIKESKNVQMIYKIYLQKNVQMEMEYGGHTSGG